MKTHEAGTALAVLLALCAAGVAVQTFFLIRMNDRIAALEAELPSSSATPLALGGEVQEIRERLSRVVLDQAGLREHLGEEFERIETDQQAIVRALGQPVAAHRPTDPAAIREAVAEQVALALEAREQGSGEDWKPSLQQLEEKLSLSEDQTRRLEKVFDDAKHEIYVLASLEGPDGESKVDEMVAALRDPEDPEGAMKRVFTSLFTDKIPGRDEAYIAEILRTQKRTREAASGILTDEQFRTLSRSNIDWLGVKTAYDPFAEHIREALR